MLKRFVIFFAVWLILTGASVSGLLVGLLTAAASAWVSLALMPVRGDRAVSLVGLMGLAPRFLWRSLVGGVDVAWRAVHPRMPLREGWLAYRTRLPPGAARVTLGGEMSLLPGTLVAGSRGDTLYVHCLDTSQDVAAHMAGEEARIAALVEQEEGQGDG
jgi:multicomponent Na+:H+ antiporter subunit E